MSAETLSFSLPEAREIARHAAVSGQPEIALTLTHHLLQKNPKDSDAHLASGTAYLALGRWKDAYRGSRSAFRTAENNQQKFQAARVSALAALADERMMVSQFWFRRAGDLAPTEVDRKRIEQQFRVVKSRTTWSFMFNFSTTPSSNVNGGSQVAYNIIDGVPLVGILSADAQALSGVVSQGSVVAKYRFAASDLSQSFITGSLFHKGVVMSDEAKVAAPNFDAKTLNASSISLGLRHSRLIGGNSTLVTGNLGLRNYWQGDVLAYTALSASAQLRHVLSPKLTFSGAVSAESRQYKRGGTGTVSSGTLALSYGFANGNRITGLVQGTQSRTPNVTFDSEALTGKVTFSMGKPVLSMMLSAGIGVTQTRYDDFRIGFIQVPGGRKDDTVFMDLEARFIGLEYAGFSPSVKLRRTETDSNISRYDTNEWAVSLGISSNF